MTVGANARNSPPFAAVPRQGALRWQDGVNDRPHDLAPGQYPLKLVSSETERLGVVAPWRSLASSPLGTRTVSIVRHSNADSVYERIKSILLQRPWVPGELLQIGVLARELGTSTTPVREALVRLASERLITYAPKKGFLVKTITEEELHGLYLINQMCLQTALSYSGERVGNVPAMDSSGFRRSPVESSDEPTSLAFITETLFLSIVASAGIEELVAMVGNINDRLHRARIAESRVIDHVLQEASAIADFFFASGEHEKLLEALRKYHELRLRMLPAICKEFLSMSFARR